MRESTNASDSNFNRGYEHWLMAEAKRRNPEIELLGLVYAWPSWINPTGGSPYGSNVTEQNAADYVAAWVSGVKTSHQITVDWVGIWNESPVRADYFADIDFLSCAQPRPTSAGTHCRSSVAADACSIQRRTSRLYARRLMRMVTAMFPSLPQTVAGSRSRRTTYQTQRYARRLER